MPADDDLAAAASFGPQDLIDRPLIMPEKILAQQRICDWMGCDLTRLAVRATYNLLYTASLLVRAHVGAALCLDGIVAPSPENSLAFIPLAPSLTSHVELIWSRSHRLSPAGQAFLDAAAAYLDEDREQALQ